MSFQLADGANPGPDYLGSTDECLGPGGDSSANNGTSMSWLLPVLCSAVSLFATWVVRKWWEFLPPATTMEGVDYATLGSEFDRINSENNYLTRSELLKLCAFGIILRRRKAPGGPRWDYSRSRPSSRASWMAARWNGTPWRFQSLSELINPTKTASFCPGETEHDGIPRYGPRQVYVNSSSPR